MSGPTAKADTSDQTARAKRIRDLNDELRRNGSDGMLVMVTSGVAGFGQGFSASALKLVSTYNAFEPGNDPYGEHDFGHITLSGQQMFWKIDYYDKTLSEGAEDPTDPETCTRVLTLMLVSEY